MRINALRKIEYSHFVQQLKSLVKKIIGKDPWIPLTLKLPSKTYSDWVFIPKLILPGDIVYSIGICDDIAFEEVLMKDYAVSVFAFDPTPHSVNWIASKQLSDNFTFKPWGVAGTDGQLNLYPRLSKKGKRSKIMYTFQKEKNKTKDAIIVDAYTIGSMAKKLGHTHIDILKMDVEGAEYEALASLMETNIRPRIILVEFHHRFSGFGKSKTEQAILQLRKNGYEVSGKSNTEREVCFVLSSEASIFKPKLNQA